MIEGKVETLTVEAFTEQSLAEIGYSYLVAGDRYSGYFARQFANEQDAWSYISPLKGQSILVRYKPDDANISAIRLSEQNPVFIATSGNFTWRFLQVLYQIMKG